VPQRLNYQLFCREYVMPKRPRTGPLKLPNDFLGTVRAFLNTPPPKKKPTKKTPKRGRVT